MHEANVVQVRLHIIFDTVLEGYIIEHSTYTGKQLHCTSASILRTIKMGFTTILDFFPQDYIFILCRQGISEDI